MLDQRSELEGKSAAALLEYSVRDFLPPERLTIPIFAERHRFLSNAGGGRGERWRNDRTPYLVAPQEDLTSRLYRTVAVVGPGQVGKTVVPENWLLHSVAQDPMNFLWYMQSEEALEAYVKDRINPMIDDHDELDRAQGPRAIDDSLHYKRFRGMSAQFLTASMSNLISKSAPRIVADEVDAYRNIFGDVKVLLDVRRQAFGDESMLLAISHPDRAKGLIPERDWNSGIMSIYADSTRCIWYWPCPHCEGWSSPNPMGVRVMSLEYPADGTLDEIEQGAFLLCPINGCIVKEEERLAMNRKGVWIGIGQEIEKNGRIRGALVERKTAGYWIVGPMSPFILGGIGSLARARVKAEREKEISGEDESLKQVIVKQFGIPYAPSRALGSVDANDLANRAELDLPKGIVQPGVRFLTIGVDVQAAYFEFLVRGWGVAGESWIIDWGRILAETATSADDWNKLKDLFTKKYQVNDGTGRQMAIRAAGFDSGGASGVAQQAYAAWTRWRKEATKGEKLIRLYGQVGGREAWSVLPLKGANGLNAAKLQVTYPDTSRKASKLAGRGEVPVALFNPNLFKDDVMGQLMKAEAGPLYIHFPGALRSKEPPHMWFEQAVAEHRLANGRWEKIVPSNRNEALDLLVMTHVLAHLHGLSRINWEKPPTWAADWNANPLVTAAPLPDGSKPQAAPRKGGEVKITIDQTTKKTIGSRLA